MKIFEAIKNTRPALKARTIITKMFLNLSLILLIITVTFFYIIVSKERRRQGI